MNSSPIRNRLLNSVADRLLLLWRRVVRWRGVLPSTPPPTNRQRIETEISHLVSELHEPVTATDHQHLLNWLDKWYSTPGVYDDAWWDEFEADLRENRLTFREPE